MKDLQKKYNFKENEIKWQKYWQDNKIFEFNWNDDDKNFIYAIDTPPPHVSGSLHMGHIFSYTHMDLIARYQRMQGKNVFYPFGFDDNGLPSEKYVEKKINKKSKSMKRHEFVDICDKEIREVELQMKDIILSNSYSFDFNSEFRTISSESRKVSQMSFIDLYNKNKIYRKEEPVIWDVVDQTSLAQTEAEDKEVDSQMNYLKFELSDEMDIVPLEIMTTRPELLPACVAIFVHPDDKEKYKNKFVITPLGVKVPIMYDFSVEKDKGTGVMMCCTFGDSADVEKYKKYKLPLKIIINEKGCLYFDNVPEIDVKYKNELEGLSTTKAREKILEILENENKILRKPEAIKHNVKIGERSKSPLEIMVKKQWNIKVLDIKNELHKKSDEINWHPQWMKGRIHSWIDGLGWDWCISRQRFFGVPVPCWYSLRKGEEGKVILPNIEQLPVDPTKDLPNGYTREEVIGETDVFDTWATSSVSPQLSSQGITDELYCSKERFKKLNLPFSLRCQGHDIIRTWAFCTIVKAFYHENIIPWKDIMISGFCLASDGTKMSKSAGNGVDPIKVINEFGSDALRYWASSSQLGTDTNYSIDMIKIGQKLITKLFNASKFAGMHFKNLDSKILDISDEIRNKNIFELVDLCIISRIKNVIKNYDRYFDSFEYGKALEIVEDFFWNDFCDNYLEIVKVRCYGAVGTKYQDKNLTNNEILEITKSQHSAIKTIYYTLNCLLKLFSPFIPCVCDEIYSCIYEDEFNAKKSASSRGNSAKSVDFDFDCEKIWNTLLQIVADVRKFKSEKNISIKEIMNSLVVSSNVDLSIVYEDLINVCNVRNIEFVNGKYGVNLI